MIFMKIKDEILEVLSGLRPTYDKTKAFLEHEEPAKAISLILGEPNGIEMIEYICKELKMGKLPIYSIDKFIGKSEFQHIIETFYSENNNNVLDIILPLYHQIWVNDENDAKAIFDTLKKVESSSAVRSNEFVLCICLECHTYSTTDEGDTCNSCGVDNLVKIYEFYLSDTAKSVLRNRQFLEIYAKHCLKKSGIEVIGWKGDDKHLVCTSINYQVEGELVDVDVHGITDPIGILLCECKTSKKIKMTDLRKVEDVYNRLTNKIIDLMGGRKINFPKVFVITGEFDGNIPIGAYKRKEWDLLDRTKITDLVAEFERIKSEI